MFYFFIFYFKNLQLVISYMINDLNMFYKIINLTHYFFIAILLLHLCKLILFFYLLIFLFFLKINLNQLLSFIYYYFNMNIYQSTL